MADRRSQPQCDACSHPISFHGGGSTECRALGCHCESWHPPVEAGPSTDDPTPVVSA